MLGLMQEWPLLLHRIIDHASRQFGEREVVTRSIEGPIVRTNYRQIRTRSLQLAKRLTRDGIKLGDRVATMAWNTGRHLETWYGISGIGAIYHTVNPRLHPEQIAWIINHAEDRIVFADLTFVPLLEAIAGHLKSVERFIILTDGAHLPKNNLRNCVAYEDWLAQADADFEWASFDERTAAGLCYTSGTTGNPKGVLYSHRSNTLHSMASTGGDGLRIDVTDIVLPVVPLFHANSWSLAFSAPMRGAGLVMPGPKLDGASVYELLENEKVTMTAGVPTVWLMLLDYMRKNNKRLSTVKLVAIGGAAAPLSMIREFEIDYGIDVRHAWGMTEMSPIGSTGSLKASVADLPRDEKLQLKAKQGWAQFGVEMKITDDDNKELPWDGVKFGHLKVSGFAVTSGYFRGEGGNILDADGFFDTGDVATIDPNGYMQITDRAKDVIKSGGEWISSIDLENIAVSHPDVMEAAVIGVPHPKWDERPLLIVVAQEGKTPDKQKVLDFMSGRVAKFWMPDDVQVISEIPHTATGKINKLKLREIFKDYKLPTVV
ncbi:MAG: long-chain-fatty-acid--CoA ligase [Hyphomicrobiales bacterium]|nr:long-chain-fatty-acid--CoA ligase [Hyphomicrobiales bacterium]MDE2114008.1 long-chain-fatty-acid--CoA ligase [Hyphomicrobiales bacterium]